MKNCRVKIKVGIFLAIGVVLLLGVQTLYAPKWNYPYTRENTAYVMDSFYAAEENEFDVIFLGTSHMIYGVSPMEIYKDTGITGFNLGGPGQPIEVSYYMLKECLKTQSPKVVIMDSSAALSKREVADKDWKCGLDDMRLGENKICAAVEFAKNGTGWKEQQTRFNSIVFPLTQYHSRYKELEETDFRDYYSLENYFSMGYLLHAHVAAGTTTVEEMNAIEKQYYENNKIAVKPNISEKTEYWLKKIRDLCVQNEIQFQMIKVPSVYDPTAEVGVAAWTKMKSECMKEFCINNDILYWDLVYDADLGVNITHDYMDGGCHLNYNGALKVTKYISSMLLQQYNIEPRSSVTMDQNMEVYNMMTELALLQLETDFSSYISRLSENREEYIVCLVTKGDKGVELLEKSTEELKKIGLQKDDALEGYNQDESYIAVINGKDIVYESVSAESNQYEDIVDDIEINITNSMEKKRSVSIYVENVDYAVNGEGINVVVIDKETGCILDSAVFNENSTHTNTWTYLNEYWLKKVNNQ